LLVFAWLPAGLASAQPALSYPDLVQRLTNLEQLAELPAAGETCRQWSSWDRASQYDEATGKYVRWDANGDGGHFIRREGEQVVMAEMEGPGCIWRIWSARAQDGHVKIYLDDQAEPAVDLPFKNYFSGDTAPFAFPPLSYDLNKLGCRGQNLYLPIPYQKSCRVVADAGWGAYYQFVYTTFPKGTEVPTFSAALVAEHAAGVASVQDFLRDRLGADPRGTRPGEETIRDTVEVAAGQREQLQLDGPRAITGIRARLKAGDREDQMAALRRMVLRITFDGAAQPQVWCPAGDFFGSAPGLNPYKSLVTGMGQDASYAYWYMPFARQAVVELVNEDTVAREVEFELVHAPLGRDFAGLGHFHCKWHRGLAELPPDRWPDWTLLQTQGRGRFCGVMLHVWNPQGGWWGEGDEKFFVDGEKYPSTFGTGSEDYFGYAWCHPGLFQRAFHAQTMTSGNRGHQSVLRWHVADNVPFQKSFEGAIEKYFKTAERGTEYACTVCWYLEPGGIDEIAATPVDQRHGYYVHRPSMAGGFKILGEPTGNVSTQGMGGFRGGQWKGNDQLWWTGAKPGDRLQLVLPVKEAGQYRLSAILTKARDYGIVQMYVGDKKAGPAIDLYNPEVISTEPLPLGTFDLAAGDQTLTVEIVGANDRAVQAYMFGLDQVLLEAVPRP
jgi:hypothetical protein